MRRYLRGVVLFALIVAAIPVVRGHEPMRLLNGHVAMRSGTSAGDPVNCCGDPGEPPAPTAAPQTKPGGGQRSKDARADEPFRYPEGKHGRGELAYRNGLPVLVAVGTPEEIGTQIGTLAVKPVAARLEALVKGSVQERAGPAWPVLVKVCEALFQKFPAEYRQEVEAMARAGGAPRELLVVANTIADIQHLGACSAIFVEPARSKTGQLLFGRNWDTPPVGDLARYGLVIVRRPNGKRAFASVTFPGMLLCGSEINDAGLAMAGNDVREAKDGSPRFNPQGTPMAVMGRRLMEECAGLADAKKALAGLKATSSGSAIVCDTKEGAVFEVTPKNVVVRPAEEGIGLCTNHFRTAELAVSTQCDRYAKLERYRGRAKLGLEDVAQALDKVNQGAATMQSMIFEPAARRLHVAIGPGPVTKRPLTVLELGPLFAGDGK
jgi:hypothetical protein